MKLYTRTGDDGQTDPGDGRRVSKDTVEMEFLGTLDELNSLVGLVRAQRLPGALDAVLHRVQSELFLLGAAVAPTERSRHQPSTLTDENVRRLEADIDRFDAGLPRLGAFVLPGGAPAGALLHLARAVCRRAERRAVTLIRQEPSAVQPVTLAYLNRLSDLLFVLARAANAHSGADEPTWPQHPPS